MRITITSKLSRNQVAEDSAFNVTAKFYDDSSDPWTLSAPTSIRYCVTCATTGVTMVNWTTVSPASSVTISMGSSANSLNSAWRPYEKRELTVQANNGLSNQYADTYKWIVTNTMGIE